MAPATSFDITDALTTKIWSKITMKAALKSTIFSKFSDGAAVNCEGKHRIAFWMKQWHRNAYKVHQYNKSPSKVVIRHANGKS